MIVYFNADGESREFAPGDTSRFELGFFFDYDPTAQEEVTQVLPPAQPFLETQIWVRDGVKYVVWQVPNQPFFMRYKASDTEISQFYSGRVKPPENTIGDELWFSSVLFGNSLAELPLDVILQGESPFVGFTEIMAAAIDARPWLEDNEELRNLWIQGIVEDRDITAEEWGATDWFEGQNQEVIDWLVLSKARGINDDDLPADAVVNRDTNRILYTQKLKSAGVSNADKIINEVTGQTFGQWFGDMVTTGQFTETYADFQILGLADETKDIPRDSKINDWLSGKGQLSKTKEGYAVVQNTSYKWLGPLYGQLDAGYQAELAGEFRNAGSREEGLALLNERFKEIRKSIFPTSMYDENLTYEDIAQPWRNFTFNILGERISESSDVWINILKTNDQTKATELTTIYGLNNNNKKVLDTVSDDLSSGVGVSRTGVLRGVPT